MSITRLTNARILRRDGTLIPGSLDLSSETGRIVAVKFDNETTTTTSTITTTCVVIDCRGQILSPGFIDVQLNGAYGVDFSFVREEEKTLTVEDVLTVAQRLVSTGTTSFCPTMVSSSSVTYQSAIKTIGKAREMQQTSRFASHFPSGKEAGEAEKGDEYCNEGANILGIHLEGPFFASAKKGAHDVCNIISPSGGMTSVLETYCLLNNDNKVDDGHDTKEERPTLDEIDIVTLAPELPGAHEVIRSLTTANRRRRRRPMVVSLGHTDATYADGLSALSCGVTFITHLYNAMLPFHHRDPGLIGLLTTPTSMLKRIGVTSRPYYSVIVDGVHLHQCAVRMAYSAHPAGCVIVTDAISAMGLDSNDNKDLTLGSVNVALGQDGDRAIVANDEARTTLAGSVASMDQCVRRFRQYVECSTGEALLCATLNPSKVLGRHIVVGSRQNINVDAPIGLLEIGAQADLLLLNDDLIVLATWVHGHLVYQMENEHSFV